jgi:hypothetical protein
LILSLAPCTSYFFKVDSLINQAMPVKNLLLHI